jgi:hypothetical protein
MEKHTSLLRNLYFTNPQCFMVQAPEMPHFFEVRELSLYNVMSMDYQGSWKANGRQL